MRRRGPPARTPLTPMLFMPLLCAAALVVSSTSTGAHHHHHHHHRTTRPPATTAAVRMLAAPDDAPTEWIALEPDAVGGIAHKYFEGHATALREFGACYCIEGVPVALLLYTSMARGAPRVSRVLLNRGLVLLFDAGPAMRAALYRRYPCVDLSRAKGAASFLAI